MLNYATFLTQLFCAQSWKQPPIIDIIMDMDIERLHFELYKAIGKMKETFEEFDLNKFEQAVSNLGIDALQTAFNGCRIINLAPSRRLQEAFRDLGEPNGETGIMNDGGRRKFEGDEYI
ncbi:hypothetical protein L596_030950 [Steinernema carpocapsae]|uniref:Uncharacterized protein n=1 Tax=Steinernema carpocapsae TaxID=34508 RepID=A0A4U5MHF0_STECR|nr:hypothetical protein L596_030950 [Steinernema carpocapsae]